MKKIEGPKRYSVPSNEREGGGLSAERTLIKNSPSILYHQKIQIAFNFIREILLRIFIFNFIKEIYLKFKNRSCLQFYKRNPY